MRSLKRTTLKYNTRHSHVKLGSLIECSGYRKSHNKGIYLGDELVGVVVCGIRNLCLWRLVSKCYVFEGGDGYARMYEDRMEREGEFETWQEVWDFIVGPLSDILLEEIKPIKNMNVERRTGNN
ncbi:hypothetical protein KAJ77_05605 [bacterium]|nr:hypothetical protein [bacterium]